MQKCFHLVALLRRELINRSFDFSSRAHGGKSSPYRSERQPERDPRAAEHPACVTEAAPARRSPVLHREMVFQLLDFEERTHMNNVLWPQEWRSSPYPALVLNALFFKLLLE